MRVQQATVGARGVDSVTLVEAHHAAALKASGIDFAVQYLGSVTPAIVGGILDAGLAFMPVTYADRFDGSAAVAELRALGLPSGCTVWLDIEGDSILSDPHGLIVKINAWADAVKAASFEPGLYVGSPQPLTGDELYALHVVRYWKAPSQVRDRHNVLCEPRCGFCHIQLYDSRMWAGVWVDVDVVQKDYEGRLPWWVVSDDT